jgi:hypothetical protein
MTIKAGELIYVEMIAAGWKDEQLLAYDMMIYHYEIKREEIIYEQG